MFSVARSHRLSPPPETPFHKHSVKSALSLCSSRAIASQVTISQNIIIPIALGVSVWLTESSQLSSKTERSQTMRPPPPNDRKAWLLHGGAFIAQLMPVFRSLAHFLILAQRWASALRRVRLLLASASASARTTIAIGSWLDVRRGGGGHATVVVKVVPTPYSCNGIQWINWECCDWVCCLGETHTASKRENERKREWEQFSIFWAQVLRWFFR